MQSMSSLQKKGATITTKADEMDRLSTAARNEYLLSLAMANAHQKDFYNKQVRDPRGIPGVGEGGVVGRLVYSQIFHRMSVWYVRWTYVIDVDGSILAANYAKWPQTDGQP